MRVTEDGVWRYYNCPDPFWSEKCRRCRAKVAQTRAPVEECLNCWKVEVWGRVGVEQDHLVGALMRRDLRVVAKASRAPILVVRTGVPRGAYPQAEIEHLLMLYAGSIGERELLREEAESALQVGVEERRAPGEGPLGESSKARVSLPVRRGCWRYDDLLGPWETWYPPDRDCPQG